MANRKYTISMRSAGYLTPLKTGEVTIPGVDLDFVEVEPQIAAFRRMIRDTEFDICELASTTYFIARSLGKPFKALPVFFNRRFHHSSILVRPGSGIETPKDIEGKRFGVRAYSVTTGVWTRGVLQNEYGVDPDKVTWYYDDEDHVQELQLPDNVIKVPDGKSLVSMMAGGELDIAMDGNAGIGRQGKPKAGWNDTSKPSTDSYHELIPDAFEREKEWFNRTGIYPCHPTLVIKDEVAARDPELAGKLFRGLQEAKDLYLARLRSGEATGKKDKELLKLTEIVGPDPLPYGLEENRPAIEALMKYAVQQKLISGPIPMEDLFFDLDSIRATA
ncbi:ABC transporter substrate-binding protein [Puniceibacterium confluentis]|uniref:ABC transporter substrate-binding protein n=1 Tax=Puniceibacterium confluentis TaxID=1958944 RepID=UPI001FEAF0C3|nr:PhnD/SsuA/transferrin family substrate-binding protein [Puniceibacterium confluentis]